MPSRLLIIDDDPRLLPALTQALQAKLPDASIVSAGSAETALAQIEQSGGMDALLWDVRLPGLGGLGLLREVKARYPDCVVILMTGHMGELEREALISGASGFLYKPVDVERVAVLVVRAVGQVRLMKTLHDRNRQSSTGSDGL